MSSVGAVGSSRPSIGRADSQRNVYEPYRPPVLQMADEISHLLADGGPVGLHIPAPAGMDVPAACNGRLQLRLSSSIARRFWRVFGYLGGIQLAADARGTVSRGPTTAFLFLESLTLFFFVMIPRCLDIMSPLRPPTQTQLQAICHPPMAFCVTGRRMRRNPHLRLGNRFRRASRFPAAAQLIALGDPVVGVVEPSSGTASSSNLVERCGISHFRGNEDFVRAVAPRPIATHGAPPPAIRIPIPPWGLSHDALFALPHLSAGGFSYPRLPRNCVTFAADPPISDVRPPTPPTVTDLAGKTLTLRTGTSTVPNPPIPPTRCLRSSGTPVAPLGRSQSSQLVVHTKAHPVGPARQATPAEMGQSLSPHIQRQDKQRGELTFSHPSIHHVESFGHVTQMDI